MGIICIKVIYDGVSKELYEIASILEKNGRPIERFKKKKGTYMIIYELFVN